MSTRKLNLVLDIDTGRYSGRLSAAGSQLRAFSGQTRATGAAVNRLGRDFDSLGNHLQTPLARLRDYVLVLANIRLAILNVRDIAVGWVGATIQQSAEVERLTVLMKGLSSELTEVGKQKEAQKNLEMLFDLSRKSGFEVKVLTDAFVKFKAGGLDPTDGSLKSLTNAVANFGGTSETFHRASIAIQQMSGKGVISMEELRQQLGEAVPTAIQDMARALGMAQGEFVKLVSKGKVAAGPALEAMFQEFERKYSGAAARLAGTLNGQIQQFKTNLMELSTVFTGFDVSDTDQEGGGIFQGSKNALEQLNAAMRSNEARQVVMELGKTINTVMLGFIDAVKFVVQWRDEIAAAVKVIAGALLAIQAGRMVQWFINLAAAGVASFRNIGAATNAAIGPLGRLHQATDAYSRSRAMLSVQVEREIANSIRAQNASNRRVVALNAEIAQLRQQKAALDAASAASAKHAQATQAAATASASAARVRSAETGTYIGQNRALAENAAAQNRAAAAKRRADAASRLLQIREAQLSAAVTAQTAAVGRANAALGRKTIALRAVTGAAGLAAGAMRGLSIAVNALLGPIGLAILAAYELGRTLGWLETRASRAADAQRDLAAGIATAAQAMALQKDIEEMAAQNKRIDQPWYSKENLALAATNPTLFMAERRFGEQLKDKNNQGIKKTTGLIFDINNQAGMRSGKNVASNVLARADRVDATASGDYNRALSEAEKKFGKDTPEYRRAVTQAQVARDKVGGGAVIQQSIENLTKWRNAAGRTREEMLIADTAIKELEGNTSKLSDTSADLVGNLNAAGDATKKTGSAANKAANEYQQAREKYANMIAEQAGQIAELNAEISGGDKQLSKFQAKLALGFYGDANAEELEKLAEGFKKIDDLNDKLNFEKTFGKLKDLLTRVTEEADQMWASLMRGTFDEDQRLAEINSRFADDIANEKDPERRAQLEQERDKAVVQIQRADSAEAVKQIQDDMFELEASLASAEVAAVMRHEREIERVRQSIQWDTLKTEERQAAEQAYYNWRRMKEEELRRQNEHQIVKMARGWANLGQNIQGALAGAFEQLVDGLGEAEFSFKDFALNIIKMLLKIILQALIAYAILSALGMANNAEGKPVSLGDFMKGQFSQGLGGAADPSKQIGYKAGGSYSVGSAGLVEGNTPPPRTGTPDFFGRAFTPAIGLDKYHTGGFLGKSALKPGEVPFIGMEGELVLTKSQQAAVQGAINGAGAPTVNLNIINNSGVAVDAETSKPRFDGREFVIDVVLDAATKPGPMRDLLAKRG